MSSQSLREVGFALRLASERLAVNMRAFVAAFEASVAKDAARRQQVAGAWKSGSEREYQEWKASHANPVDRTEEQG